MFNARRANRYMNVGFWSYKAYRYLVLKHELKIQMVTETVGEDSSHGSENLKHAINAVTDMCAITSPSLLALATSYSADNRWVVNSTESEIDEVVELTINTGDPDVLLEVQSRISNELKRSMHAWLAISRQKRITALKKMYVRKDGNPTGTDELNELDRRVSKLLEEIWFTDLT